MLVGHRVLLTIPKPLRSRQKGAGDLAIRKNLGNSTRWFWLEPQRFLTILASTREYRPSGRSHLFPLPILHRCSNVLPWKARDNVARIVPIRAPPSATGDGKAVPYTSESLA